MTFCRERLQVALDRAHRDIPDGGDVGGRVSGPSGASHRLVEVQPGPQRRRRDPSCGQALHHRCRHLVPAMLEVSLDLQAVAIRIADAPAGHAQHAQVDELLSRGPHSLGTAQCPAQTSEQQLLGDPH